MKYVPSALLGQLSRSAGSTTASHNRFGSYLRNRVVPVNPRSTLQSTQRAIFGGLSENWRALSSAQRSGWIALGQSITKSDTQGQTYTLTGLQTYISINRNLAVIGASFVTAAPAYSPPASLLTLTITATS